MATTREGLRLLCVFGQVLGNKVYSARLVEFLSHRPEIEPTYLFLDTEDYRRYPAPWPLRAITTLESAWVARRKYLRTVPDPVDAVLFQGFSLSLFFSRLIRSCPAIVALDTTPTLATEAALIERTGIIEGPVRRVVGTIWKAVFGRIFGNVDVFLPWSAWCAASLERDFGVPRANLFVTYCPLDLEAWSPVLASRSARPVVLFVGNDFRRKGGDLLLEVYRRHLRGRCILRIVSNDPAAPRSDPREGVEVLKNIPHAEMRDIYASADVFVFPTQSEPFGIVLTEAMAMGLPIVASNIGAIGELVKDGRSGFLLPPSSAPSVWADRIGVVLENRDLAARFGRNGRVLAEEKLSFGRFERTLDAALARVHASVPKEASKRTATRDARAEALRKSG